jgi:hypothetical protein
LNLSYGRLSDKYLQRLADILMDNTVRQIVLDLFIFTKSILKTLTTLDLKTNEIGDRQIQFLANALQNNKVGFIFYSYIFTTQYRH